MQYRYKNLLVLILLLLIFFLPMSAAYWLYYNASHLIQHTSEHGLLLNPSIPAPAAALKDLEGNTPLKNPFMHHWTLLAVTSDKTITSMNLKKLYTMRQIRLMLGKNSDKLQRMLIFYPIKPPIRFTPSLMNPYAGTLFFTLDDRWQHEKKSSQSRFFTDATKKDFLIVDPHGQIILVYAANTNPKFIMQDLKKLIHNP